MHSVDMMSRLGSSPLFEQLSSSLIQTMLSDMTSTRWRRSSKVLSQGDAMERFFIIVRGRIKIWRHEGDTGRELTLFLLGPGDAFDVASLLDGQPAMVAVRAIDDVTALGASIAHWRRWMDEHLELRHAVERYAAWQLRALTELASGLSLHSTICRLAQLLLRSSDAGARWGCVELSDLSHEELACLIGSTRVVVSRLLARLKKEGTIDTSGRSIRILNEARMRRYAHPAESASGGWTDLVVL